jgi:hypothetical protein
MLAHVKRQDEARDHLNGASTPASRPPSPSPPKTSHKRTIPAADGAAAAKKRKTAASKARASATPQAAAKPKCAPKLNKSERDWLTDLERSVRERRRRGGGDEMAASELDKSRPAARSKEQAAAEARAWREEVRNDLVAKANAECPFPDNYHLYRDESGRIAESSVLVPTPEGVATARMDGAPAAFLAVALVRPILKRNQAKKAMLRLYESDAEPRHYAAYMKQVGEKSEREGQVLAPTGSQWTVAWKAFRDKFRELTGVEWSERERAMPGSGRQMREEEYYFGNFMIQI